MLCRKISYAQVQNTELCDGFKEGQKFSMAENNEHVAGNEVHKIKEASAEK